MCYEIFLFMFTMECMSQKAGLSRLPSPITSEEINCNGVIAWTDRTEETRARGLVNQIVVHLIPTAWQCTSPWCNPKRLSHMGASSLQSHPCIIRDITRGSYSSRPSTAHVPSLTSKGRSIKGREDDPTR